MAQRKQQPIKKIKSVGKLNLNQANETTANSEENKPEVEVLGVVETLQGLLLLKDDSTGKWSFPGGDVKYSESVEDALRARIKEQVKVDVHLLDLIGIYSDFKRNSKKHKIAIVYYANTTQAPESEKRSFKEVSLDATENLNFVHDHGTILEDFIGIKEG